MVMDPVMGHGLGVLVVVVVTAAVLYVAAVYQRRKTLLPGPWPWPFIGSLPVLMSPLPYRSLQKLSNKYGGLMYLQLGQKPCLVVSTAAAVKEVIRKHDAAFASRPRALATDVITNGTFRSLSFTPYNSFWRNVRRVANTQLFSPAVHASHEGIRKGEIHRMMRVLLEDSWNGKPVNLKSWLTIVTANNMTMMLTNNRYFGGTDAANEEKKKKFEDLMRRSFAAFVNVAVSDFIPHTGFIPKLQGLVSEFQAIHALGTGLISDIIQVDKHREQAKMRGHNSEHIPDFVDVLLKASIDGELLPDKDIVTLIVCLMNAGSDTSALTVEWGMSELMAHPSLREQAQAEIDAVVGHERLVHESDHVNLPFLSAVIKETYRLHPSVPLGLRRESHEPCIIKGCALPAQTELIFNIFAIHRDPAVYDAPDEFRPLRFVERPEVDPLSGYDHFELMPFVAGRRMCPGSHLANTMVTSMMATLLQCFDWSLPDDAHPESLDMSEYFYLVKCRTQPLRLVAHPRKAASLLQV